MTSKYRRERERERGGGGEREGETDIEIDVQSMASNQARQTIYKDKWNLFMDVS